jgi:hypothetical protein
MELQIFEQKIEVALFAYPHTINYSMWDLNQKEGK